MAHVPAALQERGLTGVRLFITDKCLGLVESLAEFYPDAAWQRCVVHCCVDRLVGGGTGTRGRVGRGVAVIAAVTTGAAGSGSGTRAPSPALTATAAT